MWVLTVTWLPKSRSVRAKQRKKGGAQEIQEEKGQHNELTVHLGKSGKKKRPLKSHILFVADTAIPSHLLSDRFHPAGNNLL